MMFAVFFGSLLVSIVTLPFTITACIALNNTSKWSKANRQSLRVHKFSPIPQKEDLEANASDSDSEPDAEDILDSEDEAYYAARRSRKQAERDEKDADTGLTFGAKFRKEYKKCWRGSGMEKVREAQKVTEESERRKIAKDAVREYIRMQRKRERKAKKVAEGVKSEGSIELPSYGKAIGGDE